MPPMRLPDLLQRGAVITSLAACGYGGLLIFQGFAVRAARRKELEAKIEQERMELAMNGDTTGGGLLANPGAMPS